MSTTEAPIIAKHLPAIYQEGPAPEREGLLDGLLSAHQEIVDGLDARIDGFVGMLDPSTTPAPRDFLAWLGSWVSVDVEDVEPAVAGAIRESRQRRLVNDAARLWRERGTASGLRSMLEACYDAHVEIDEWAWPRGMTIDDTSVIGVNTALMEDVDLRNAFVAVWQPPSELEPAIRPFQQELSLRRQDSDPERRTVRICVVSEAALSPNESHSLASTMAALRRISRKLRNAIDREQPAHARCYLALGWERPHVTTATPMQIDVKGHSTIGLCYIE